MSNNTGNKFGGRSKGTSNKLTSKVKEALHLIFESEIANLPTYLDQLEPKQRIEVLIKLLPYVVPKAESETSNEQHGIKIEVIEKMVVI